MRKLAIDHTGMKLRPVFHMEARLRWVKYGERTPDCLMVEADVGMSSEGRRTAWRRERSIAGHDRLH
jgi:hypothetical protein